jgi:Domain of unknown function (DUF3472)/Domain of unknown function (DUF5077)
MNKEKIIAELITLASILFFTPLCAQKSSVALPNYPHELVIPVGGNAFQVSGKSKEEISEDGIIKWQSLDSEFAIYVALSSARKAVLSLNILQQEADSKIKISINEKTIKMSILKKKLGKIGVGLFNLKEGYNKITLKGLGKNGVNYARINELILQYEGDTITANFVRDNEGNNFYWGRRGPSVHLNYPIPKEQKFIGFYNELVVLEDPIGSFFMANGFKEGYFGIQVNSKTERRVLFSVWSPFETDNPKDIPEDQKIKLLKKGKDVHIGEFGDEGSGGQSYLVYNWKAGVTYNFYNSVIPDGKGNTIYTAYFMDSKVGKWQLIASFLRPKTNTWYTNPHSFVENFEPENGYLSRKVSINNQWMCDNEGTWTELANAILTGDILAKKRYRIDFNGGVENNGFFLQNGGFLNSKTSLKTIFNRDKTQNPPVIELKD